MTCTYNGLVREIRPHILGHSGEREKALVYQYGGETSTDLPPDGEWRCFELAEVTEITLREAGPWHTGRGHRRTQSCVNEVYVDVNEGALNQPGRHSPTRPRPSPRPAPP